MLLPRALQSFEARAHLLFPQLICRALVRTHRHHKQISLRSLVILSSSTTYHTSSPLYPSSDLFHPRLSRIMARPHSGLSHQHHHHDNTYLISTNKKDAGVRITRIGLYVNFCMAIGKGLGGYLLNSQALVADAFHSLTDLVSDFLTLATVSWSLKPPTSRFPGGYGKIESLGSLGVSSLLLAGGIGLGWHSGEILYSQFFLDAASSMAEHGHSHGGGIFGHSHSHNPADMVRTFRGLSSLFGIERELQICFRGRRPLHLPSPVLQLHFLLEQAVLTPKGNSEYSCSLDRWWFYHH